jgi:hypothetical protein
MQKQNELTNYSSQIYVHKSLLETTIWQIISARKLESCKLQKKFDKTIEKPKSNKKEKHDQTKNL